MQVRCPQCHTPIELASDGKLSEIACPGCGSSFSLVTQETAPYDAATKSIGHFDLVEQIGFGSFGSVWKAKDRELDRVVAVKVPRKGQLSPEETEQFLREARAAAQLRHPNIVAVHEVGRDGDSVFIVSDFVQGVTLADRLTARPYSVREAAELCAKIADALQHAHEHGVVHRDLKPGNIILDAAGEPHIMDFGLARREADEVTMTMEGKVLGTPAYMSPEQARGSAHTADGRSDVYSLGVILFELVTGELPYRGNIRMLIHQKINDEPPSPRRLNANVPRDVETICLKCMEKEPGKRYATAGLLAGDLRRFLAGEPITARPVSQLERIYRLAKRKPLAAGLLSALFLSILGGFAGTTQQWIRARGQAEHTRRQLYVADMNVANEAWDEGIVPRVWELLKRHVPQPGRRDLRCFEWYYLWRQASRAGPAERVSLPDAAYALAYSPRGDTIAVAHAHEPVTTMFNTSQPTDRRRLGASTHPSWARNFVAFSADGETVAYPSADWQRVCVYSVTGGVESELMLTEREALDPDPDAGGAEPNSAEQHFNSGDTFRVAAARFSPTDAATLAIGDNRGFIRLVNIYTGKAMASFALRHAVHAVAFSRDGLSVGAVSVQGEVRIWELPTGQEVYSDSQKGAYCAIAFSSRDNLFASSGEDEVRLVDLKTGQRTGSIGVKLVYTLDFSPNGTLLATGGRDRIVRLWRVGDCVAVRELRGHFGSVMSLSFSPTKRLLASASTHHTVLLWNFDEDKSQRLEDALELDSPNYSMVVSPNGELVATCGHFEPGSRLDGTTSAFVRIWRAGTLTESTSLGPEPGIISVASSANGLLAAGSYAGLVTVWSWQGGVPRTKFAVGKSAVTSLAFSPDGEPIISGDADGRMASWSTNGDLNWGLRDAHAGRVQSLAFSRDGKALASAGSDGVVMLWDAATGEFKRKFVAGSGCGIIRVSFSPFGERLAVGSQFLGLRVWNLRDPQAQPDGFPMPTTALVFGDDGKTLFTGGNDGLIKVWDSETLEQRATLNGHANVVNSMSVTSDGKTLVSCSWDGSVRFWRTAREDEVGMTRW